MAIFVKLFFYISCQIEKFISSLLYLWKYKPFYRKNLQKLLNRSQYVSEWLSSDSMAILVHQDIHQEANTKTDSILIFKLIIVLYSTQCRYIKTWILKKPLIFLWKKTSLVLILLFLETLYPSQINLTQEILTWLVGLMDSLSDH